MRKVSDQSFSLKDSTGFITVTGTTENNYLSFQIDGVHCASEEFTMNRIREEVFWHLNVHEKN